MEILIWLVQAMVCSGGSDDRNIQILLTLEYLAVTE
jgi:hypothetical protein